VLSTWLLTSPFLQLLDRQSLKWPWQLGEQLSSFLTSTKGSNVYEPRCVVRFDKQALPEVDGITTFCLGLPLALKLLAMFFGCSWVTPGAHSPLDPRAVGFPAAFESSKHTTLAQVDKG